MQHPPKFDGEPPPKKDCIWCGKRAHPTQRSAEDAAKQVRQETGKKLTVYLCPYQGIHNKVYHLSSRGKFGRAGRHNQRN